MAMMPGRGDADAGSIAASDAALDGLAHSLLGGLARVFPVADLFWEETVCSAVPVGQAAPPPSVSWRRGVQLRVVGRRRAASAWTTDLTSVGLRRIFETLASGVVPPRALPLWPTPALTPASIADTAGAWREWAEGLVASLRRRSRRCVSARALVSIERFIRGAAPAPDRSRVWSGGRVIVTLEAKDALGRRGTHCEMLGAMPRNGDSEQLERAVLDALESMRARTSSVSGMLPIVLAPGAGTVVLHEIVGHALEADRVLTGASPLSGVARDSAVSHQDLTIRDSPDARWGPGGLELDDEGQRASDVVLIERGRLAGSLHDRTTALMSGVAPTGNGRRACYETEPAPRMRNIVVDAGPTDPSALIEGLREGLAVERVSGAVDPSTRSFELTVEAGYIIRHGARRERVRGLRLRGDTLHALQSVRGVGNDVAVSWTPVWCEKRGAVITGVAGPTILMGPLEVWA